MLIPQLICVIKPWLVLICFRVNKGFHCQPRQLFSIFSMPWFCLFPLARFIVFWPMLIDSQLFNQDSMVIRNLVLRFDWYKIWLWVNTYRYIFGGMNIHFNPAMTWGEQKVPGFWPIPICVFGLVWLINKNMIIKRCQSQWIWGYIFRQTQLLWFFVSCHNMS